ncbi:myelin protein zero-like protein 1 isoform X3 [Corvus moneduloides]|uniref:myelin protein zero-like protein 1 isoform X3 n=1 Tax=Corvus moneduloides TaxID=1196302 RepID=UPI001362F058|nr:myelin protein zero-like protein 1 isoform X3 [Corvus moneduloides]
MGREGVPRCQGSDARRPRICAGSTESISLGKIPEIIEASLGPSTTMGSSLRGRRWPLLREPRGDRGMGTLVLCPSISSRGQHPGGDVCGERDGRKAPMHIHIRRSDQQRSICLLELSTRGSSHSYLNSLPAFPIATVAGIAIGTVTGLSSLISIVVCLVIRKNNSKKRYSGCSTSESLMSPVKQAPQKAPSDTEGLVNSVPARSHQGPVIYAQLDHSGGQHSDKINKSESVVYADIRKN